ncbi:hypothetical protein [Conchiformibius steedae]|uniref:hypothetical protein n=1 Tax=Conchiformibius steedae TaxID=153493 RepID=UPI0026EA658F|nr:hypothetical protein [Conchiformibius steedae]
MNNGLTVVREFLIDDEQLNDDGELGFLVASAEIKWWGNPVTTVIEGKEYPNILGVIAYHFGDGDVQIGDEQTLYYFNGNRSNGLTFDQLPMPIQEWVNSQFDCSLQIYLHDFY